MSHVKNGILERKQKSNTNNKIKSYKIDKKRNIQKKFRKKCEDAKILHTQQKGNKKMKKKKIIKIKS